MKRFFEFGTSGDVVDFCCSCKQNTKYYCNQPTSKQTWKKGKMKSKHSIWSFVYLCQQFPRFAKVLLSLHIGWRTRTALLEVNCSQIIMHLQSNHTNINTQQNNWSGSCQSHVKSLQVIFYLTVELISTNSKASCGWLCLSVGCTSISCQKVQRSHSVDIEVLLNVQSSLKHCYRVRSLLLQLSNKAIQFENALMAGD